MKKEHNALRTVRRAALAPYGLWAVLFIVVPLFFVAYYAFTDQEFHFTTANIVRFFTAKSQTVGDDGSTREVYTYLLIFLRSLKLAVISTVICLVMGYPIAYILSRAGERAQKVLITLYKNGGAYQTYTCTAPANSSDTWNYTVRDLPKYENGREISWTVDEAPVEGYSKSIRGMTITNTYGNRTQGARTEDRNPILLYAGIALAALGAVVLVLVLGLKKK